MSSANKYAHFYILLNKMGLNAVDRRDFLMDYTDGLYSSLSDMYKESPELYYRMLRDMQASISNKKESLSDTWRKRVMASIGGYLKMASRESNDHIIKGIACKATGYDDFNSIPVQRLINIYNTFLNKQKDFERISHQVDSIVFATPCIN